MSRLVSLAAGVVLDIPPEAAVSAAAEAGFDGAGVWFDPSSWTPTRARHVRSRLDATGLVALDIEPVILGPAGDRGEALIAAGAEVGARYVLVASRDPDRPRTVERFGQLCDVAADHGLVLVLEFLPIMAVRTLADAHEVIAGAGRANAGILVDSLHLSRSGGAPSELAGLNPGLLPYVQIADAPRQPPEPDALRDEALEGRLLPGEGELPLVELLAAVPGVPISVELRSRSLTNTHPDPVERARIVLAATRTLLAAED